MAVDVGGTPSSPSFQGARYAYGVLRTSEIPTDSLRGLFDRPVRFVDRGGLAAAISDVDDRAVPGRREDLLGHFGVLEQLAADATVLPLRFGTVFDSDDEVELELLVRRRPELEQLIADVDGLVELSLRATYVQDVVLTEILAERRDIRRLRERTRGLPEDATHFDRISLGELVAEALEDKRRGDRDAVLGALSPLAAAIDVGTPTTERGAVSASFLVRRRDVGRFEKEVRSLEAQSPERIRLHVTGPLPPYSFVSLDDVMATQGRR